MTTLGGVLPQVGQEIPCSSYAVNVPLQVNVLGLITLDFKGGIRFRVEETIPGGMGGVKMKIIGEEYSADSPILGKLTLARADVDTTPLSLLEVASNMPPVLRHTLFHDFTLTIEKPPGGDGPAVLSNPRTMTTRCDRLTAFPPQGDVYQLQQPVDFAPLGAPGQVVAQLLQFPMTRSHNP